MSGAEKRKPFAKRSLGQNFLADSNYIAKIIEALDIQAADLIVEIGPGRGALTEQLVLKAESFIGLELDRHLVPLLTEKFASFSNAEILEADALEIDFADLVSSIPRSPKLVANLPYYISTAILQRLIDQRKVFSMMVLMFQKEVVDRIAAEPGNSERGFLTVLVEAFFKVEKLFDIPPAAFRPQPKVWSSVVRITPAAGEVPNESMFRELVSSAFVQKRKTILNNLKGKYPNAADMLARAEIDPKLRPEALTLDQWFRLVEPL
jgi:16S rRNA (adenine1518-N6/adenine1519-N6)-dimethyltransferase